MDVITDQHDRDLADAREWARRGTLRVWGGHSFHSVPARYRSQVRVIVSAKSAAAAHRLLADAGVKMSRTEFADFWSTSSNTLDMARAEASPGQVLWQPLDIERERRAVMIPWSWDWPEDDS